MRKNGSHKIRVGIIGANPDRGWAMQAHIPALKSLSDDFEITALSTSRSVSAAAAGKLFGVPLAFDNHHDLVKSAAVDVVAITVKVPSHFALAADALTAGKAVYCEWPLGNGLEEAEHLAALAKKKGVLAVVGLQARFAPSVAYVHDLITQGQEKRRDDAFDRAGPRGGRHVPLPRRGPRALGHHDGAPKDLHDRGNGRTQAQDRG